MAAWSLTLPVLKRVMPLRSLVRLMWTEGRVERSPNHEQAIAELSSKLTRLRPGLRGNCLERSLLAYRYLARSNADPRLVIAVKAAEEHVVGHAWVRVDDRPLHESLAQVREFVPVAEFGAGGDLVPGGDGETLEQLKRWA
jgi:Transglutaminase-like superfamily